MHCCVIHTEGSVRFILLSHSGILACTLLQSHRRGSLWEPMCAKGAQTTRHTLCALGSESPFDTRTRVEKTSQCRLFQTWFTCTKFRMPAFSSLRFIARKVGGGITMGNARSLKARTPRGIRICKGRTMVRRPPSTYPHGPAPGGLTTLTLLSF